MADSKDYYQSDAEVEAVVRGFENCTTLDSDFNHASHLTLALSYLYSGRSTVPEATERIRVGLYRFLDHHGQDRQIYNETITLFWVKLVKAFLDRTDTTRSVKAIANEMIESFGDSKIIYNYYSKKCLLSEEARKEWVEPDVKSRDEG